MTPLINDDVNRERPERVTTAVQLLSGSLVLGLLTASFNVVRNASGKTMLVALVIVVIFFGLGFLLAWRIAAGKNWARIFLLVLVVVGTPLAIPGYRASLRLSTVAGLFSIFINLLQLITAYLLFTGSSNSWFRKRK
ncbi:MAG TPA: hypothetical protein VIW64_01960 [Pyrinomonadaceae bacterium]|jgi:hypothetical protein